MAKDILNPGPDHNRRQKQANFVINLGLAFNALLAAGKSAGGIVGHSQALLADGVNSLSDVAYFLMRSPPKENCWRASTCSVRSTFISILPTPEICLPDGTALRPIKRRETTRFFRK